jgi:hypothetical protein
MFCAVGNALCGVPAPGRDLQFSFGAIIVLEKLWQCIYTEGSNAEAHLMPSTPSATSVPWPDMDVYDRNRATFSVLQLAPYEGQWVAFSSDGSQLIAAAQDLLELDRLVEEAGFNPEEVLFERIVTRDVSLGGIEIFG